MNKVIGYFVFLWCLGYLPLGGVVAQPPRSETPDSRTQPIIDSAMTEAEAFAGLDPACPPEVRARQKLVTVTYFGFDDKLHQGQLVIDQQLEQDLQEIFRIARECRFPFQSVIPISHPRFRRNGRWDDDLSMQANNTSAFNYRVIAGTTRLSNHAFGRAIDINPMQNPYVRGDYISPKGATYAPRSRGTLTADHPLTRAFRQRGWEWGGTWESRQDYQHFEKPLVAEE